MRYTLDGMLPEHAFKKSLLKNAPATLEGGGKPAAQPSQTTTTVNPIADWAKPTATALISSSMSNAFNMGPNGEILSSKGFTPFGGAVDAQGQFTGAPISQQQYNQQLDVGRLGVAGPSALQQKSYEGAANLQMPGQFNPATGAALAGTFGSLGAGNQYNQMATNPYAQQAFMSPYIQNALQPQLEEMQRQYGITGTQQQSKATQSGAFGGGREAIMAAENDRNKNMAMNQAIGQGYQRAFDAATQAQQYGANLGLQGYGQGIQGAGQLASIGQQQLAAQQGILGTQNQMGTQQQQNEQNVINQAIQNYANQQNFADTKAANIMNLVRSTPTTQQQTQYQAPPSAVSQIAGLGTAGIAGYKLATMAEGGKVKEQKFDVGGRVESNLYDLPTETLAQIIKNTQSQTVKQTGTAILRERAMGTKPPTGYAPGGIVAFADGGDADEDEDYEEAKRLVGSPMGEFELPKLISEGIGPAQERQETPTQGETPQRFTPPKSAKEFYQTMYTKIKNTAEDMGVKNPEAIAHLGAAQSAVETGYGKHVPGNNFFGIKGAGSKQTTQEYIPGKGMVTVQDSFRGYASPEASIKDYVNFLQTNSRYKSVLEAPDVSKAIAAQAKTGYATDPEYGKKLNSIYASMGFANGGEIKGFSGEDDESLVKPDGTRYANKEIAKDAANLRAFRDRFVRSIKNTGEYIANPVYEIGKGIASWGQKPPEEQYKQYYPEKYANAQAEDAARSGMIPAPKVVSPNAPNAAWDDKSGSVGTIKRENPPTGNERFFVEDSVDKYTSRKTAPAAAKPVAAPKNQGIAGFTQQPSTTEMGPPKELMGEELAENEQSKEPSFRDRMMQEIMGEWNKRGETAKQDRLLSLLSAGLGIAGGTSPYAAANIGQGAQQGIAAHMAARRNQQEEQKSLLGAMSALDKQRFMENYYKGEIGYKNKMVDVHKDKQAGVNTFNAGKLEQGVEALRVREKAIDERTASEREKIAAIQSKNKNFGAASLGLKQAKDVIERINKAKEDARKNDKHEYNKALTAIQRYGVAKDKNPTALKMYDEALAIKKKYEDEWDNDYNEAAKVFMQHTDSLNNYYKDQGANIVLPYTYQPKNTSSSSNSGTKVIKLD